MKSHLHEYPLSKITYRWLHSRRETRSCFEFIFQSGIHLILQLPCHFPQRKGRAVATEPGLRAQWIWHASIVYTEKLRIHRQTAAEWTQICDGAIKPSNQSDGSMAPLPTAATRSLSGRLDSDRDTGSSHAAWADPARPDLRDSPISEIRK